ncbi:hypothetical protein JTB14_028415 [Gonioctena quinquepunctata]|nr:hypothetical protein JTB14_028415 [Gonioctena quinquepunctata]
MLKTILARLHWLKSQDKIVRFCRIPSHQGIAGNEIADRSARMAASQGNFEDIPLRPDDIKSHLRNETIEMWQREWDRTENKLKIVKPSIRKNTHLLTGSRRDQVVLCRLRIGHTCLTNSFMLLGVRQPRCEHCGHRLTVQHITQCPHNELMRQRIGIPAEIQQCLEGNRDAERRLVQFLKIINIYHQI